MSGFSGGGGGAGGGLPETPLSVLHGGSNATTASGARTSFGLGTAAVKATGTTSGTVPLIGADDRLAQAIGGSPKNNVGAGGGAAPPVNADSADGYSVGSLWITVDGSIYYCLDPAVQAAIWWQIVAVVAGQPDGMLLVSSGTVVSVGFNFPNSSGVVYQVAGDFRTNDNLSYDGTTLALVGSLTISTPLGSASGGTGTDLSAATGPLCINSGTIAAVAKVAHPGGVETDAATNVAPFGFTEAQANALIANVNAILAVLVNLQAFTA